MSKIAYCLFDNKSKSFVFFGFFRSNDEAKRTLAVNVLRSPDIMPALYPDDFTLFGVAEFFESISGMPFKSYDTLDGCGTISQILADFRPASVPKQEVEKVEDNA